MASMPHSHHIPKAPGWKHHPQPKNYLIGELHEHEQQHEQQQLPLAGASVVVVVERDTTSIFISLTSFSFFTLTQHLLPFFLITLHPGAFSFFGFIVSRFFLSVK
jgi:hypothetical protein